MFLSVQLFMDAEDDDGDDLSDNFIVNFCKRFIPVTGMLRYPIYSINT